MTTKRWLPSLLALLLCGWLNTPAAYAQCSSNQLCVCNVELGRAVEGKSVSWGAIEGGLTNTAAEIFRRGGSQNIPVVCGAVRYRLDHDPRWFQEYFRIQAAPGSPGFLGTEVLSPLYMQSVLGAVLSVREHAVDQGHTELLALADRWLRGVWAIMALGTVGTLIDEGTIVRRNAYVTVEGNHVYKAGVSVPVAGSRTKSRGNVGINSLLHPFMSVAIDWQPRSYRGNLRLSPGFYGGLLVGLESLGFEVGEDGFVSLGGFSPPPQRLGLNAAQQAALRRFVEIGGREGLGEVLAMVGELEPSCDLTFLRTTEGLTSWFGTSQEAQHICNRNKGPYFAARFDFATDEVTWLHPTVATNPAESGDSYREGDQICARLEDGSETCMRISGGQTVYEISWTREQGLVVVQGETDSAPAADSTQADTSSVPAAPVVELEPDIAPVPEQTQVADFTPLLIPGMTLRGPLLDTIPDADEGEDTQREEATASLEDALAAAGVDSQRLPETFRLTGSATGSDGHGHTSTCVLDLTFQLANDPESTSQGLEFTAARGGRLVKTVDDGRKPEPLTYAADVSSLDAVVRFSSAGEIEIHLSEIRDPENSFYQAVANLEGTVSGHGAAFGEWECAPFEVDEAGLVDSPIVAQGSWEIQPVRY